MSARRHRDDGSSEPPTSPSDDEDEPAAEPGGPPSGPGGAPLRAAGPLRFLFYGVWLLLAPMALSLGAVWLLTPAPTEYDADVFRSFVGEQQVPAMILFFTLFAMIIWRFRHALPLAGISGLLARRDLPASLRARFDEAAQLIEESQSILRIREREVERELSRTERTDLRNALDDLAESMAAVPLPETQFLEDLERAEKLVGEQLRRWRKGELREYAESIGIAVAVALLLRVFVIEAFKIPSGSMIPTLLIGDHIFVAKYAYGPLLPFSETRLYSRLPPARGDVMVFKFPENPEQDFIKRVVALPGDKLEALDGRLVLNGWLAPHCYVGRLDGEPGASGELYLEFLHERAYLTLHDSKTGTEACSADGDCGAGQACRGQVCGTVQGPFYVAEREAWVMGDNRDNSHDSRLWRNKMGAGVPFQNIKGRAMFVWLSWNQDGSLAPDRLFVGVMGQPVLPSHAPERLQEGLRRCLKQRPPLSETTPLEPG